MYRLQGLYSENNVYVQKTRCMYRKQGVCTENKMYVFKYGKQD